MGYTKAMNSNIIYSPSLLASDFSRARETLVEISESGCDYVHLDVMDGYFVPQITFGHKFIADIRENTDLIFDTHLMVEEPERLIKDFIDAGANIITIHQEATRHLWRGLAMIKDSGIECGVAINPGTSVSAIEAVLPYVDYVLVMSVNPGFGGQRFIPEALSKISELDMRRKDEGYGYQISVDGGIGKGNIKQIADAGANIAVMGTAFFKEDDKKTFIEELDSILER